MFNLKLKLKLNFDEDKTYVSFKLLDKSPIKGNVINPVSQISLDDAKELLEKYGPNKLTPPKQTPEWVKLFKQMTNGFAKVN